MDKIYIRDIQVSVHIGVGDEELSSPQIVVINITMETMFGVCSVSDNIADTVDYDFVTQSVIDYTQQWRGHLLERLAVELAGLILTQVGIDSVTVLVDKPDALKGRAASAAVEVTRKRVGEAHG